MALVQQREGISPAQVLLQGHMLAFREDLPGSLTLATPPPMGLLLIVLLQTSTSSDKYPHPPIASPSSSLRTGKVIVVHPARLQRSVVKDEEGDSSLKVGESTGLSSPFPGQLPDVAAPDSGPSLHTFPWS